MHRLGAEQLGQFDRGFQGLILQACTRSLYDLQSSFYYSPAEMNCTSTCEYHLNPTRPFKALRTLTEEQFHKLLFTAASVHSCQLFQIACFHVADFHIAGFHITSFHIASFHIAFRCFRFSLSDSPKRFLNIRSSYYHPEGRNPNRSIS